MELDPFVGNIAHLASRILALTALSHLLMEEELVTPLRALATHTQALDVRSGDSYGTQFVEKVSTMLHAVFAVPTVSMDRSILELAAKNSPTEELLVFL